jgi:hypothetical protein
LLVIFGSLAVMPAVKAADAVADFDSAGLAKAATFFGVLALEVLAIRWLLAKLWLWQVTR